MDKSSIFQFKITLWGITPLIWRRIQISECCSFWDLHVAIQDAMGWTDSHLHQFEVFNSDRGKKEFIGIPDANDGETLAGWKLRVKDYMAIAARHGERSEGA